MQISKLRDEAPAIIELLHSFFSPLPPLISYPLQNIPAGHSLSQLGQDGQNLSQSASSVPAQGPPPQQPMAQASVHQQLQPLQIPNSLPPTHLSQVLSVPRGFTSVSEIISVHFPLV